MTEQTKAELSGEAAKLAAHLKTEYGDRIKAAEARNEELQSRLMSIQDGVAAVEEQLKSTQHHGMAYVEGADDAFNTDDPAKRFNLHRGIIGHAYGWDYDKTPYRSDSNPELWPERDILDVATTKAQSAGVNTEGGFAAPEQFNSEFIPILLAQSTAMQMGVRFMTDFRGSPVVWPRIDTASQAYWVAENVAPTESETELGQISMTPHDLAALIPISNRLMFQTSGGFESMLREHMARIHAITLDAAIYNGTGASGQPLGLANVAGIGTMSTAWVPTVGSQDVTDRLSDMVEEVDTANALEGSLGFVMHPAAAAYFRKVKDADTLPILTSGDPNVRPGSKSLYGYNAMTTTQLGAGPLNADLFFGNWADAMVGQWGTMTIDSSNVAGNAFFKRQTYIRAVLTVDFAVMHPESFVSATNLDL